jgi:type IV pilus assembly protein PilM
MLGKKGKYVGLDIGYGGVKIAEFQESRSPEFDLYRRDLKAATQDGSRKDGLARLLREMVDARTLGVKKVIVNFQSEMTLFKYLELPHLTPRELAVALPIEAQKFFPWSLDETILTYVQVPPLSGEKDRTGVTFSALGKKQFQDAVNAIKFASLLPKGGEIGKALSEGLKRYRLNPAVIEIPAMSLCRATIYNYGVLPDSTLGLINVGERFTNIAILRGEYIYFARDILMGGKDFTRALMQGKSITFQEAEDKKRTIDLADAPDFNILPALEKWAREIKYSFDFYQCRQAETRLPIDGVILSGGSALLKGLNAFLEEILGIPVEIDKTKRIAVRSFDGGPVCEDAMLHFKTAMGLALRGIEK